MNSQQTVTDGIHDPMPERSTSAYLPRRRLVVARVVWITQVAFTLSVFFAGLPILYAQLERVCVGNDCLAEQLTPDTLQVLHNLDYSTSSYAAQSTFPIVNLLAEQSAAEHLVSTLRYPPIHTLFSQQVHLVAHAFTL